jgi:hypothetical protein
MADSSSYDGTMQKFRKQIEEILLVRGPQEDLHSRRDVLEFAVEQLWERVMASRSGGLHRLCAWRKYLR